MVPLALLVIDPAPPWITTPVAKELPVLLISPELTTDRTVPPLSETAPWLEAEVMCPPRKLVTIPPP